MTLKIYGTVIDHIRMRAITWRASDNLAYMDIESNINIIPVVQGEDQIQVDLGSLPETLPILALRNAVLFPNMVYPVTIGREKSIALIKNAERTNGTLVPDSGPDKLAVACAGQCLRQDHRVDPVV